MTMSMNSIRGNRGFTMTELMATIAIIGIVSALAFVSIFQYQRDAYQNEMDETAKQIYIAAQNHLTVADSLGTLPTSSNASDTSATAKKTQGTADTITDDGKETGAGIYYYVLPDDSAALNNKKSMLSTMLPQGSIDETVRSNGSYIIRYQCNDSAVQVLDVFYANTRDDRFLQSGYSYTFSSADFAALFAQGAAYRGDGDADNEDRAEEERADNEARAKEARADYNGAIIGYYGGADAADSRDSLKTPILEVHNAEELTARLVNPPDFDAAVKFEFYAIGDVSGAISKPIVADVTDIKAQSDDSGLPSAGISVVLDSVTQADRHFAQLGTTNEEAFIPGENIKIQVFALDTASTKVSRSAKRTTNSLFASVSTTSVSDLFAIFEGLFEGGPLSAQAVTAQKPVVAKIANIRHLENLSTAVSGYVPSALGANAPTSYEQTANLSWSDFRKKAAGLTRGADGQMPEDTAASLAIQIHPLTGDASSAHTYMPVDWPTANGALEYKGNALKVEGVEISASDDAGLFGSVNGGNIANLELVDFQVQTTSGNAGALAGATSDVDVSNVLVRHEATSAASDMSVNGATAGGLVGKVSGGSVKGCAAAVLVNGSSEAGGLVGSASGASSIEYSYSGGHTTEGKYASANVSGSTAGGLVGRLSESASVSNCYSTCSVAGVTADRLVGSGSAGTTSYAVGSIIGAEENDDWGYADSSQKETYDSTVAGGAAAAVPYDDTLTAKYNGKYQFKAISEFAGASAALGLSSNSPTALTKHLTAHYGDWPAIVTWVVNV